jgi:hypothetical protein
MPKPMIARFVGHTKRSSPPTLNEEREARGSPLLGKNGPFIAPSKELLIQLLDVLLVHYIIAPFGASKNNGLKL